MDDREIRRIQADMNVSVTPDPAAAMKGGA